MKRSILISFFILSFNVCFAQKLTSGSLEDVFAQETLNVEFDFSKANIDGVKESALLNIGGERASDWKRDKEEICAKFIFALHNKVDQEIEVGHYADAKYTLVFIPASFDDDGEVRGSVNIINKEGGVVAVIEKVNGDGGRWGSFTNLCGDAMERAGENVGLCLWREHKKIEKAQKAGKK